ncbi:hypothetical protein HZU77_006995 [Neisseriaceae bacterium TC5R-5]|nr:hypothetical protein [Neisseriaceae bacterium TC5R-5]
MRHPQHSHPQQVHLTDHQTQLDFEQWVSSSHWQHSLTLEKFPSGQYVNEKTAIAFDTWQAAEMVFNDFYFFHRLLPRNVGNLFEGYRDDGRY